MTYRKSPVVAKELGISYFRLIGLLRSRKISPPEKDSSGHFAWNDSDLEAARKAIQKGRPASLTPQLGDGSVRSGKSGSGVGDM